MIFVTKTYLICGVLRDNSIADKISHFAQNYLSLSVESYFLKVSCVLMICQYWSMQVTDIKSAFDESINWKIYSETDTKVQR